MITPSRLSALVVLIASVTIAAAAHPADQPISATRLVLKRSAAGKESLVFSSKDPAFLFPAPGSADDPASGTPGGATIDLFAENGDRATFTIPAGAGKPGWSTKLAARSSFRFGNHLAPQGISSVRNAVLTEERVLTVKGAAVGLPLSGAHGAILVRITTGSLRSCARFAGGSIVKDKPGLFMARSTTSAGLADCNDPISETCTDGSFGADQCGGTCPAGSVCSTQDLSTCVCISEAQPCGDTWPVCNGECPVGEECLTGSGFPLPGCICLPSGSTACAHAQCNGDCPAGQECNYFEASTPGASGCTCGPPGPCGSGGDDCPAGFHCAVGPMIGPLCVSD